MNKIVKNINSIFKNIDLSMNLNKIKLRNNKISIKDAIRYRFIYSQINKTKEASKSIINYDNNKKIYRTTYDRKEKNISSSIYINILNKIRNYYNNDIALNKCIILSVDGTFNNTINNNDKNSLDTSLSMGYYDTLNDVPYDLDFKGPNKKNTELEQLKLYIEKNNLKNIIIVADRAYYKYEFFKYLDQKGIKYVIRIKDNSQLINIVKKNNKHKNIICELKNNNRIIKCQFDSTKNITNKKNITLKINKKTEYNLITNIDLSEDYDDSKIIDIYNSRWKIETFFKLFKNNFKFSYFTEKEQEQYKKNIIVGLIITYLNKIIKHYYLNLKSKEKSKSGSKRDPKNNSKSVNETNIITGIYEVLLEPLINGRLTVNMMEKFINSYVVLVENTLNRTFQRKCKCPFKKWYIKMYHDFYKYKKIKDCISNNETEKLDKNLKLKAKNIKIT